MSKSRFNRIQVVFLIIFIIVLFFSIVYSTNPFQTSKTCSQIFDDCSDSSVDDVIITPNRTTCNGTQTSASYYVSEVYINASSVTVGNAINVTCRFKQAPGITDYEYIWYYNTSDWISIQNYTDATSGTKNKSVVFNVNSSIGTHTVRCVYNFNSEVSSECVNSTYGTLYDNDDVNFTVVQDAVAPNVTDFWFEYLGTNINKTNLNTSLVIFANVSDDSGWANVTVNITYPDSTSVNATMSEYISNTTWNFTFGINNNNENLELNQTGNYTIRIYAIDNKNYEKASGVDPGCQENKTFYVNNTYTLNLNSTSTTTK